MTSSALVSLVLYVSLAGPAPSTPVVRATPEDARRFVAEVNDELKRRAVRVATAEWIKSTYITDDTERNAATQNSELMAYLTSVIEASKQFDGMKVDAQTARMLRLLRLATALPAPKDATKRERLAAVAAKLEGHYGKAKVCGAGGKPPCRDLTQLEKILRESHATKDERELFFAWKGWHDTAKESKPLYAELVSIGNEGARELGHADLGELWRSNYEMSPAAFEAEVERLWQQVKPLYESLHCYTRRKLSGHYGTGRVAASGPIPAHLLGNMWAQDWSNIYPLVEPYPGKANLDVTEALKKQNVDPQRLVRMGENFFLSLGFDPLPKTFWERSMFVKPQDRDVVCHASAWDVTSDNDVRIKMCIQVNEEDLITVHHELGHIFYFQRYFKLPYLYQQGAHDGFHEAIGDAVARSITPAYLKQVKLLDSVSTQREAVINQQMKDALEKVAFLPFARLVDQWRYEVFSGRVKSSDYNTSWWELRRRYQGIAPSVPRNADAFDAGAKYHVPANVPYARYFLSHILQFQFHKAMCELAGQKGPLHECSVFGSKAAGERLKQMLSFGASRPWTEALTVLTRQQQMEAGPLLDYFAPLRSWLAEQNRGQSCGW
ncbi:MAG: M2 family metallopeptidase [Myxococcaceae bacterium]